jgi:hypothetical protein
MSTSVTRRSVVILVASVALIATGCTAEDPAPDSGASTSDSVAAKSTDPAAAESSTPAAPDEVPEFESLKGPQGAVLFTSLDGTHTLAIGKDWVLEEPSDLATWTVPLTGGGTTRVNIIPEIGHSDQGMDAYLDYALDSIRQSVEKLSVIDRQVITLEGDQKLGRLDVRARASGRVAQATSFVKIIGDTAYTVGVYSDPKFHAAALQQLEPYLVTLSAASQ